MATLNLIVGPVDPLLTIESPQESQNSYYRPDYDRAPIDVNSIWYDYQMTHGRYAMLNPMIDHYALYYGGNSDINDMDLLATSFDYLSAIFSQTGPRNWFTDDTGNSHTYHGETPPLSPAMLANYNLNTTSPSRQQRPGGLPGDIVVVATLSPQTFSASELRQMRLNLDQAIIQQSSSQVYNDYYSSILSKATGFTAQAIKELETIIWQTASDNILTYQVKDRLMDITISDLRYMIRNFDYNVITGLNLPVYAGGGTDRKPDGSGWYSNVETQSLITYFQSNGSAGMYWYVIHEFVHNIQQVKDYEISQNQSYQNRTGDTYFTNWGPHHQEFRNIENMTNEVYRHIANDFGFPVISNPPGGYFPTG